MSARRPGRSLLTVLFTIGIGVIAASTEAGAMGARLRGHPLDLRSHQPESHGDALRSADDRDPRAYWSSVPNTAPGPSERAWPPCRTDALFLAAKATTFAIVAFLVGEVVSFVAFFAGQSLISGGAPHATITQSGVLGAVIGSGLYLAVLGLLAVGLGLIIRHTAGALAAFVGVLLIIPLLTPAFPSSSRTPSPSSSRPPSATP